MNFPPQVFIDRCLVCKEKHAPKCEGHEALVAEEIYNHRPVASQREVDLLKAEIAALQSLVLDPVSKSEIVANLDKRTTLDFSLVVTKVKDPKAKP